MKRTYEILTHKGTIKNSMFQITPLSIKKINSMKKLSAILLTAILVMGTISCTDLAEEPYSTVTTASFFKNETDAEIAINGIYNGLHDIRFSWQEGSRLVMMPGMFTVSRAAFMKNRATYSIDYADANLNQVWLAHYNIINRCNMAIKYLPQADMSDEKKNSYIAEARWVRSYLYFNLVRLFGDLPKRIQPTEVEADAYFARSPISEIYSDIIIPDLEFAAQNLPETGTNGRVGKGAAPFLLGKVYLTMAGKPLQDPSKLTLAKENLEDAINNHGYNLMSRYIDVFPISEDRTQFDGSKELNAELIFSIQQSQAVEGHGTPMSFTYGPLQSKWTSFGPGGQHLFGYMEELYNEYDDADERRDVNLVSEYIHKGNGNTIKFGVNPPYNIKSRGMVQNKVIDPDQNQCCNGDPDMIIYRLADAYLMLAEVENELNGPGPGAYDNLDVILSRANAPLIDRNAGWTKESLLDEIWMERVKELNFEFHDLYDLRRLGKVKDVFDFNLNAKVGTYDPKFELYPIPRVEIDVNPNCEQNSGW